MAQAIRAILLASAMAATFVGRRANNAVSQGRCLAPWTDLGIADNGERTGHKQAAQIAAPCLLIPPSLFLPPLECCFGICGMPPRMLRACQPQRP
jgi:hypothetical protein